MAVRSYKDLMVWQKSIDLIDDVYRLCRAFPKSETYGLSSQLQRAAVSVAANIAEGSGRDSTREFIHHLAFSLGSFAEVETYLVVSVRLEYAAKATIAKLESKGRRDRQNDPQPPESAPETTRRLTPSTSTSH